MIFFNLMSVLYDSGVTVLGVCRIEVFLMDSKNDSKLSTVGDLSVLRGLRMRPSQEELSTVL